MYIKEMDSKMKFRFMSLYQMILVDGIIDVSELETLYRIGKECYGIGEEQINAFISDGDIEQNYPTTFEDKVELLYQLAEIAWADGEIDDSEMKLLKGYVVKMGFYEENSTEIAEFLLKQVENKVSLEDVLNQIKNGLQ